MQQTVEIYEVGPRDGLQNEPGELSVAQKVALIDCLSRAGFRHIEVASFVSPKWVPQMAGSADVLQGITRAANVSYTALTPNLRGFEAAVAAKADEVAIFGAASEAFSKANINATIDESLERFSQVTEAAKKTGMPVRGYVSCVTDCPYDGPVAPEQVARVAVRLLQLGCHQISLGETLGRAKPEQVDAMLRAVTDVVPASKLAGHFHDTGGVALGNIEVALDYGLRVFDASIGGLGGCPYAPGAAGNVATSAVHARLGELGFTTGLDARVLEQAADIARELRSAAGCDDRGGPSG